MGNELNDSGQPAHREPYGVAVPRDDPDIHNATLTARETLPQFIERIVSPTPGQAYQAVKIMLAVDGRMEYIWVEIDSAKDGQLLGALPANANSAPSDPTDQPISVSPAEVFDWMIVDDGRLVGGYTLRVMYAKMDAEQRRKFNEVVWYRWD